MAMIACSVCGKEFQPHSLHPTICVPCYRAVEAGDVEPGAPTRLAALPSTSISATEKLDDEEKNGSVTICVTLGLTFIVIGLFLLMNPEGGELMGRSIVNMQKLAVGQTFCIMGSIFMAAALRPRR